MIKIQSMTLDLLTLSVISVLLISGCSMNLRIKSLDTGAGTVKSEVLESDSDYWDFIKETVPSPILPGPAVKPASVWFENGFSKSGFAYVYGGKTAQVIQPGTKGGKTGILSCYLDNSDYSGVTVSFGVGNNADISKARRARAAGIGFWAKAGPGLEKVYFGLLDDGEDNRKVQTKLPLRDFGKLDTAWTYFMFPLKRFSDKGKYWDAGKKMEILANVDWTSINEFRFSTNKGENKSETGEPLRLYIASVILIEEIPGYVDPAEYWAGFQSAEPDGLLHNFETPADRKWETGQGPGSSVSISFPHPNHPGKGEGALSIQYKLYQWCDVIYDYERHGADAETRDWSRHWGLKLDIYVPVAYQPFGIQVGDSGGELFYAAAGASHGWSTIIVPFKTFEKFPYYQPPEAEQNGKFDLTKVRSLDIKPGGEGNSGNFLVDNIRLTNDREGTKVVAQARKQLTLTGAMDSILIDKINPGIFGINAQTWDTDLLAPGTESLVKAVGHGSIRFPGGLTSDEYHWKPDLKTEDITINTDEFLNFCRNTGNQPVITANFGTGTPEEAAEWVTYVNITKKAGARYWEIGNELYGNWHKNHCSAAEYGERAVQFIQAMKAADPHILIGVVWQLSGQWNEVVFNYVKHLADAVIVHNYPQLTGEENDANLLGSPQRLEGILAEVRRNLSQYGSPGKRYHIWLTEWNSVNFNPGPQSLGIVNALFVADYLGMLAQSGIEMAHYWNIHNGLFERGGDYGYLSRSDAPEGVNVPRPAYGAFKLAREGLQGEMFFCRPDDINVSIYGSKNGKKGTALLLINKYPSTTCEVVIQLPGISGKGIIKRLTKGHSSPPFTPEAISLRKGGKLVLPPYSISLVRFP